MNSSSKGVDLQYVFKTEQQEPKNSSLSVDSRPETDLRNDKFVPFQEELDLKTRHLKF